MTNDNKEELEKLTKLAVELRDLLFDDASSVMQGGMVGSPVECVAFAKWWIQRAKGLEPDEHAYFASADNLQNTGESNNTDDPEFLFR